MNGNLSYMGYCYTNCSSRISLLLYSEYMMIHDAITSINDNLHGEIIQIHNIDAMVIIISTYNIHKMITIE